MIISGLAVVQTIWLVSATLDAMTPADAGDQLVAIASTDAGLKPLTMRLAGRRARRCEAAADDGGSGKITREEFRYGSMQQPCAWPV